MTRKPAMTGKPLRNALLAAAAASAMTNAAKAADATPPRTELVFIDEAAGVASHTETREQTRKGFGLLAVTAVLGFISILISNPRLRRMFKRGAVATARKAVTAAKATSEVVIKATAGPIRRIAVVGVALLAFMVFATVLDLEWILGVGFGVGATVMAVRAYWRLRRGTPAESGNKCSD